MVKSSPIETPPTSQTNINPLDASKVFHHTQLMINEFRDDLIAGNSKAIRGEKGSNIKLIMELVRVALPQVYRFELKSGQEPAEGEDISGYEAWEAFIRAARDTKQHTPMKEKLKAFLQVLLHVPFGHDEIKKNMPPSDNEIVRTAWNEAARDLTPDWVLYEDSGKPAKGV